MSETKVAAATTPLPTSTVVSPTISLTDTPHPSATLLPTETPTIEPTPEATEPQPSHGV